MTTNHEIPFGRPYIDDNEKAEVLNVLDGHILTHGPKCKEFEKLFGEFICGGTSISTSSCMASLHISAIFLGLVLVTKFWCLRRRTATQALGNRRGWRSRTTQGVVTHRCR